MTAVAPPVDLPPDPFAVECLVAAIGIEPFVSKELRRVHGYHAERAGNLRGEIARKVYRFLQRETPEPTAELPDFSYDAVAALLDAETMPSHVEQQIAAFGEDGETALAVQVQVMRIVSYLKAKLPRRVRVTLTGPEYSRPPEVDIARFARTWAIACDPMIVLDDLNEYAVSRDQVKALAEMFPQISAVLLPVVQEQLIRAKTVQPSFHLFRQKETQLRVLTQQEAPNIALGKAMQAMYKAQAEAAKPAAPKAKKSEGTGEITAAQRIDS